MKKLIPDGYILEETYQKMFGNHQGWKTFELSSQQAKDWLGNFPNEESTITWFASGSIDPRPFGTDEAYGGLDWVRWEKKPKKSEPELNLDHFVIGPQKDGRRPYWKMRHTGCRAEHWSDLGKVINAYYSGNHPDDPEDQGGDKTETTPVSPSPDAGA